jgi:hypothetical protein
VAEDTEQLIDRGHLLEETLRQDFHGGMSTTNPCIKHLTAKRQRRRLIFGRRLRSEL